MPINHRVSYSGNHDETPAAFDEYLAGLKHVDERYGPHTTCVNRFNRWRKARVWDRILTAVSKAYDGDIQMIDASSIRVNPVQNPPIVHPRDATHLGSLL